MGFLNIIAPDDPVGRCRLSKNPKPPLRGEVARRSRVGGVGAKSLEYVGKTDFSQHPTYHPSFTTATALRLPLKGSLGGAFFDSLQHPRQPAGVFLHQSR